ncbi:MAG: kynureninase [Schleiferiaceae bacterium]
MNVLDKTYSQELDSKDSLAKYRKDFHIPVFSGKQALYFTGNSLGLMPKLAEKYMTEELEDWKKWGVEGHFHARRPWMPYHEFFSESLAKIVGGKPEEVVVMGSLTNNLHLLMVSFFRPKGKRTKILCEAKAFPSDQYALASQLRFHGLEPSEHLIEIGPRHGEHYIHQEDIRSALDQYGDQIAMMMIGGVNYYTGQVMDMKTLTAHAQSKGIIVGWDLAHGAGNVELQLHDWNVDFAAWCHYKYINSGPGATAGYFIHERHHGQSEIPRFEGWWGHDKETRFEMPDTFKPIPTAEAWQLSNAPVMAMAPLRASLDLFEQAGFHNLRTKSEKLTAYLQEVLEFIAIETASNFEIITPRKERGAQLSLLVHGYGKPLFDHLTEQGVIADWREPNVIRMAPVPLYNSFEDVRAFGQILMNYLNTNRA